MTSLRATMKSSLVIVLALGCGILAVFWPQWRGELRAQGYYPGFGAEGKVTTAFEDLAEARAVAIQADGKIVAAGFAVLSGDQHFALARYNGDGALDTSFGTGGKVTTDFFGFGGVNAVAIQADGRIVAAGFGGGSFALARYNRDGTLDAGFGTGGKVTTFFGGSDVAWALAIQADGKIVAAGDHGLSPRMFAVARYNMDGTLDAGFGDGGKVTTDFGSGSQGASAVAIQADGKIVAAGFASVSGFTNFALARYNTDGTLDTNFGTEGKVTTDFSGGPARAVAIQADGKIVAAGFSGSFAVFGFALARYNTDGTLDTGFGDGGKVITAFGGLLQALAVAIQGDDKIVAAGNGFVSSTNDFAVARYSKDGALDTTFGAGGIAITDFIGGTDIAFAAAIQPDARIVAAGYASTGSGEVFALARYDSGLTPLDLAIALSARVEALVNAGTLNPGQGNSLDSKLAHVVRSLDRGQTNPACNQLRAFIHRVDALIRGGVLTSAQGDPLIGTATGIANTVGCR